MAANAVRNEAVAQRRSALQTVLRYTAVPAVAMTLLLGPAKADVLSMTFPTKCGLKAINEIVRHGMTSEERSAFILQKEKELAAACRSEKREEAAENAGDIARQEQYSRSLPLATVEDLENARKFCGGPGLYVMYDNDFAECMLLAKSRQADLAYYLNANAEACADSGVVRVRNNAIMTMRSVQLNAITMNRVIWDLSKVYAVSNDNVVSKSACGNIPLVDKITDLAPAAATIAWMSLAILGTVP